MRAVIILGFSVGLVAYAQPATEAERPPSGLDPTVLYARASQSVVVINTPDSQGSGVVLASGEVVTNAHVIAGAQEITVQHGQDRWPARVIAADADFDLAILAVEGLTKPGVQMRDSNTLKVGERVYAVGAPQGYELTLTDGLVSALRPTNGAALIQISVPISPGSSGGGLFDTSGRLVGITTSTRVNSQNLNFAHPCEWIASLRTRKPTQTKFAAVSPDIDLRRFSVTHRPEVLRCNMNTRAMWATFSSGAEVLGEEPVDEVWTIKDFDSQTPGFHEVRPNRAHDDRLVLADFDRAAGAAIFTSGPDSRYTVFFADGLMLVHSEPTHVLGQPRIVSTFGKCEALARVDLERERVDLERELAARRAKGKVLSFDPVQAYLMPLRRSKDANGTRAFGAALPLELGITLSPFSTLSVQVAPTLVRYTWGGFASGGALGLGTEFFPFRSAPSGLWLRAQAMGTVLASRNQVVADPDLLAGIGYRLLFDSGFTLGVGVDLSAAALVSRSWPITVRVPLGYAW